MNFRIALARSLLRWSDFLRTLPVVVMHPADMIEFSRQAYDRSSCSFYELNNPDAGLTSDELVLWERVPYRAGQVLILGGGGGREAIFFARQGFEVTGVDFSSQMMAQARQLTAERGLNFQGWESDISLLEAPSESFDMVWFSMFLYSVVLNRSRRMEMLHRIYKSLKPGGCLVCSFHWEPEAWCSRRGVLLRKVLAWLTLGNTGFENGDILFGTIELRHAFASEAELQSEFTAAGFELVYLTIFDELMRGGAVLRKPALV